MRKLKFTKRKRARSYKLYFTLEGSTKMDHEEFKFLKAAREEGMKLFRQNRFIGLENNNGIKLCL